MLSILFLSATLHGTTPAHSAPCDRVFSRGSNRQTHVDADDDSQVVSYSRSDEFHCESAYIVGIPVYTLNEDDVASMPVGSRAVFRERNSDVDRTLTITRSGNGSLNREFELNGSPAPYDDAARRWFAAFLPRVLASAGLNIMPRIARWRAEGGIENVLRRIEDLGSSGSMREHYQALLGAEHLSDDAIAKTLRSLGSHLESDGDKRQLFHLIAPQYLPGGHKDVIASYFAAVRSLSSSGDMRSVLVVAIPYAPGSADIAREIISSSRSVASSGDRASVLSQLVSTGAISTKDLRDAFFASAEGIPSDGDKSRVLRAAAASFSP